MSTRCNTVHPGRAPLPGPPGFTTVVFDMSKTTGKTPGSSRSIRHHPGPSRWTTVQPPVLPGSPRSMDRGEPGSTGSPVGLGQNTIVACAFKWKSSAARSAFNLTAETQGLSSKVHIIGTTVPMRKRLVLYQ